MSRSLLDLSGRIDPVPVEIFDTFASVAGARHIHYFVVGETARDMILSYGHGIAMHGTSDHLGAARTRVIWPSSCVIIWMRAIVNAWSKSIQTCLPTLTKLC